MENKKEKPVSLLRMLSNNLYGINCIVRSTPVYAFFIALDVVRHNVINFLEQTICVYMILNAIETHRSFKYILLVVGAFLLLDFIAASMSCLYEQKIKIKYLPIAQKSLKDRIYEKARKVELKEYDDPTYYSEYCMVVDESNKVIDRSEQLLRMFFGSITILFCYGLFFLTQDRWSVVFILVSYVLRTIFSNIYNKLKYKIRLLEIPLEKKRDYIKRIFYLKNYAKEIRLNKDVTKRFHEEFDDLQDSLYSLQKKYALKKFFLDFLARYISADFMLDIVYVFYLVVRALIFKMISFSQVVTFYNSAAGLRRGLSMLTDMGAHIAETSLYIEKIRTFLDKNEEYNGEKTSEIPSKTCCLECRNVSFGYEKDRPILRNVNLTINPGEKIALVGHNGAGKTTLIKLLLRLYTPSEGEILLNGINIEQYDLNEYRKYLGVVFQDFHVYATSIEQNVTMDISDQCDEKKVEAALEQSGLMDKVRSLPDGIKTEITTEFEDTGTELSGGQMQKLAIADLSTEIPLSSYWMNPPPHSILLRSTNSTAQCTICQRVRA